MRMRTATLKGVTGSRQEALGLVKKPGDLALIERGKPRSIVIQCPDGCGDKLTINLDAHAGEAWRLYSERSGITLYPSVWRTSGCLSHFILWSNRFYWMDWYDPKPSDVKLKAVGSRVLERLSGSGWMSVPELADDLSESPWLVASACRRLTLKGKIKQSDSDENLFSSFL